jgi:hypothetical protein
MQPSRRIEEISWSQLKKVALTADERFLRNKSATQRIEGQLTRSRALSETAGIRLHREIAHKTVAAVGFACPSALSPELEDFHGVKGALQHMRLVRQSMLGFDTEASMRVEA